MLRPLPIAKTILDTRDCATKSRPAKRRTHTLTPTPTHVCRFERASKTLCLCAQRSVLDASDVVTPLSVELSTEDVQNSIQFDTMPLNGGKTRAIVVSSVLANSACAEAGIQPGMRLLQLSDPIQANQVWSLNDRASLRYVKDAVRMQRAGTICLTVQALDPTVVDRYWSNTAMEDQLREERGGERNEEDEEAVGSGGSTDVLAALIGEVAEESNESDVESEERLFGTIGERLQRRASTPTALQRRIARRQEYMSKVNERNDAPFFLGLLALFVLPALLILSIVSMNGYLDYLSQTWAR